MMLGLDFRLVRMPTEKGKGEEIQWLINRGGEFGEILVKAGLFLVWSFLFITSELA